VRGAGCLACFAMKTICWKETLEQDIGEFRGLERPAHKLAAVFRPQPTIDCHNGR